MDRSEVFAMPMYALSSSCMSPSGGSSSSSIGCTGLGSCFADELWVDILAGIRADATDSVGGAFTSTVLRSRDDLS